MRNSVAEPSESGVDLELWKDSVKRVYGDRGMLSRESVVRSQKNFFRNLEIFVKEKS